MKKERFTEIREYLGLTKAATARRFYRKPLTASRWESGECPIPEEIAADFERMYRDQVMITAVNNLKLAVDRGIRKGNFCPDRLSMRINEL
jgi:transcriptional regulator with XRE-family HTH domain